MLDLGCGTGVVAREAARRVAPSGRVVGVDSNSRLLGTAQELAEQQGVDAYIEWHCADARRLPFCDAQFDVVLAITVLAHVPEGDRAIAEMLRVLRPGGRVGILEPDPTATSLAHPDMVLTERIYAATHDLCFADGSVAQRLASALDQAGSQRVQACVFTTRVDDPRSVAARVAEMRPSIAARTGAITETECKSWLAALRAEKQAGRFHEETTYRFVWGTKPTGAPSGQPRAP